MLIREATPEDASAIAALTVACWRSAYCGFIATDYLEALDIEELAGRILNEFESGPERLYVCEHKDGIIGFVTIGPCRDDDCDKFEDGEIWGLYVAPEHWREGIGTLLCNRASDLMAAQRFRRMRAWVFADNAMGLCFYAKMGFEPDGASKMLERGVSLRAVRLLKPLGRDYQADQPLD